MAPLRNFQYQIWSKAWKLLLLLLWCHPVLSRKRQCCAPIIEKKTCRPYLISPLQDVHDKIMHGMLFPIIHILLWIWIVFTRWIFELYYYSVVASSLIRGLINHGNCCTTWRRHFQIVTLFPSIAILLSCKYQTGLKLAGKQECLVTTSGEG